MYPEYYRKMSEYVKGSNVDLPQPFLIGRSYMYMCVCVFVISMYAICISMGQFTQKLVSYLYVYKFIKMLSV